MFTFFYVFHLFFSIIKNVMQVSKKPLTTKIYQLQSNLLLETSSGVKIQATILLSEIVYILKKNANFKKWIRYRSPILVFITSILSAA